MESGSRKRSREGDTADGEKDVTPDMSREVPSHTAADTDGAGAGAGDDAGSGGGSAFTPGKFPYTEADFPRGLEDVTEKHLAQFDDLVAKYGVDRKKPPPDMSLNKWKKHLKAVAVTLLRKAKKRSAQLAKAAARQPPPKRTRPTEEVRKRRETQKAMVRAEWESHVAVNPTLVMDCAFWDLMTDREKMSSITQVLRSIGNNKKRASRPCRIMLTGLKKEMYDALMKRELARLWVRHSSESYEALLPKESLVYLTADSTNTLTTLDPSKAYIIGAFVDRNRHKGATLNKATAAGIPTARLPIGEYLEHLGSQVLTTTHVVDIIHKFLATKDWKSAVYEAFPDRKKVAPKDGDEVAAEDHKEDKGEGDEDAGHGDAGVGAGAGAGTGAGAGAGAE